MDNPTTPDVTPQTRDTLLEQLNFLIDGARSNLMDMKASLAIDGTKEQLAKMLRDAYNLGATAHEENMMVPTTGWAGGVEVRVEIEEGGFSFEGDVNIDSDTIREAVDFENHNMTDEQVDEILKS
jgi:Ca2+-binding EF-hand superfamily protein